MVPAYRKANFVGYPSIVGLRRLNLVPGKLYMKGLIMIHLLMI